MSIVRWSVIEIHIIRSLLLSNNSFRKYKHSYKNTYKRLKKIKRKNQFGLTITNSNAIEICKICNDQRITKQRE